MTTYTAGIPHFVIDLPHLRSEFEALNRLGTMKKLFNNVYRWTFPLPSLPQVSIALNGAIIEFDKDIVIKDILPRCDPAIKELNIDLEGKGKGKYTIHLLPEGYRVCWRERVAGLQSVVVSRYYIEMLWEDVICKLPKGERPIRKGDKEAGEQGYTASELIEEGMAKHGHDVAKMIMRQFHKHHWDIDDAFNDDKTKDGFKEWFNQGKYNYEKSGRFNWAYFQGSRKYYKKLYQFPLRVLTAMGIAEHKQAGNISYVVRLADPEEFDRQAQFFEGQLMRQDEEEGRRLAEKEPPFQERKDWYGNMGR